MGLSIGRGKYGSGSAAAARVVGLGLTAALAVTVSAAPGIAWAEAGDEATAGDALTSVEAAEATYAEGVDVASEPASDAVAETQTAVVPDASAGSEPTSEADVEAAPVEAASVEAEEQAAPQDTGEVEADAEAEVETEGDAKAETEAETAPDAVADTTVAVGGGEASERAEVVPAATQAPAVPVATSEAAEPAASTAPISTAESKVTYSNMYRLYNPYSGEHLYTADLNEAKTITALGWRWEGIGWVAPSEGDAVWRLYNPYSGDHHFTTDRSEYDYLGTIGWKQEGIGFRSAAASGAVGRVTVYREFNPYEKVGTHNYTTSSQEDSSLGSAGWRREGIGWYGADVAATPIQGFWLETSAWGGGTQRYWVDSSATVAKGRYVDPSTSADAGAGYKAYATPGTGAVVRGAWYDGSGHVYLADSTGRLADSSSGWLVTGAYDNGTLQRYRMDGYGRAKTGEFTVDGKSYLGRTDTGYVVRGTWFQGDWRYIADNDGVIQSKMSRKEIYVTWAMGIANDQSHGYSQINRWGPDYDCSALVISALRQAGYETGSANSTRDMRRELKKYGWEVIEARRENLQYGDILLHDGVHTALWCGDGKLVEAWADENNSWEGYRTGDQTGSEIRIHDYYDDGWLCYLRHA